MFYVLFRKSYLFWLLLLLHSPVRIGLHIGLFFLLFFSMFCSVLPFHISISIYSKEPNQRLYCTRTAEAVVFWFIVGVAAVLRFSACFSRFSYIYFCVLLENSLLLLICLVCETHPLLNVIYALFFSVVLLLLLFEISFRSSSFLFLYLRSVVVDLFFFSFSLIFEHIHTF